MERLSYNLMIGSALVNTVITTVAFIIFLVRAVI